MTADAAVDATPVPTAPSQWYWASRRPVSTANPSSTIIPSATLWARSSAIFILKPWLPLVAFARLQQEHSSCKLRTSSSPSSLGAKKPMVERRKPIVTEWALADACTSWST